MAHSHALPDAVDDERQNSGEPTMKRSSFIAVTLAFGAILVLLLSHRSDYPAFFGRYSAGLLVIVTTTLAAYSVVVGVYFYGWRGIRDGYVFLSCSLVTLLLLLVGINVSALMLSYFTGSALTNTSYSDEIAAQDRLHADLVGLPLNEFTAFRLEQGRPRKWQYEPWVGFKETPFQGKYLNVSPGGFRNTEGTPAKPARWVFMLGGSTTFGTGVTDEQTIASYLQARLNDTYGPVFGVRNFGRAYYYSSQEFVLLWRLLFQGERPDVVIFFDGMNESQASPYYVDEMRALFDRYQDERTQRVPMRESLAAIAGRLPINPYLQRLSRPARSDAEVPFEFNRLSRISSGTTPADIARQYEAATGHIRSLTSQHSVVPFFTVQPIPGYRNKFRTHAFLDAPVDPFMTEVVKLMESTVSKGTNGIVLTGVLADYSKQAFVDPLHYTPEVNRTIAHALADGVAPALQKLARSAR
jgi:hypothetical protein